MRVLLLSWEYPPVLVGGLGRHVHALSGALGQQGHEVTVVTGPARDAPAEEIVGGVRVLRAPADPPFLALSTSNLLAWTMALNHSLIRTGLHAARTTAFDVIHAHDWLVTHAAVALKEQLELPLVATIHATEAGRHQGWLPEELNRSIHGVECWLVGEATRVIVCSHYMRWEVHRLLQAPSGRIDVVPNGVEAAAWQSDEHVVTGARARFAGSGPLIGFAGRLVYEKGVQDIIQALPELRSRHPGIRLVVAGDGPHRPSLLEQVQRLGLGADISFAGFLGRDLAPVMAATDAMVVPSIYEPFGMVALEAAAAGVPVAAAATGGLKEIIEPGRTGMTFPPATPPALARAVSRLISDAGAARHMARKASHMVAVKYTWENIAQRVVRVYASAVATDPAGARPVRGRPRSGHPPQVLPPGNLLRADTPTPPPARTGIIGATHRARASHPQPVRSPVE